MASAPEARLDSPGQSTDSSPMKTDPPIRDAATIVLCRRDGGVPRVLMGQRGSKAAFMPSKFVFPGGRVDDADARVPLAAPLAAEDRSRLALHSAADHSHGLAVAAIRELWEETGLRLAVPDRAWQAPPGWEGFATDGLAPAAETLSFFFRAVTPPGRPRRFDARFFLADADALADDPDDFSRAGGELSHLRWIALAEARSLDLPFITEVVLAELAQALRDPSPRPVPFFDHSGDRSVFRAL